MTYSLGIDVSKETLDIGLLFPDQRSLTGRFTNDLPGLKKLERWAKRKGATDFSVCLEATGRYSDQSAEYFFGQGYRTHVVNPARTKAYRNSLQIRDKTDKIDGQVIAQFGASQTLALWKPSTNHQREIKEISRHLDALKKDRARVKNRLKAGIRSELIVHTLMQQLEFFNSQIKELEKQLTKLTETDSSTAQDFKVLCSIIGFGALTAASVIAETEGFKHFEHADQVVAHAGLSPTKYQSGTSVSRKTHISKAGNKRLRTLLYMPALSAIQHNPAIREMAERLEAKGKPKKVIICAAMRKLLVIAFTLVKKGELFDPNYSAANF